MNLKKKDPLQEIADGLYCKNSDAFCSFQMLDDFQKGFVLLFLKQKKRKTKVFERKGYDILRKTFFVEEYQYSPEWEEAKIVKSFFEDFESFYDYVSGEIYDERTCFYGYSFTKSEIESKNLELEKLNFRSFFQKNLNWFQFDIISFKRKEMNCIRRKEVQKLFKWMDKHDTLNSYRTFLAGAKLFTKNLESESVAAELYLFLNKKKYGNNIGENFLRYSNEITAPNFSVFTDIMLAFGEETAEKYIENFNHGYSYPTILKYQKQYRQKLELFRSGRQTIITSGRFDEKLQLYIVFEHFFVDGQSVGTFSNFFLTFNETVAFLNNDLSFFNLSRAPIPKETDFSKFKKNEKTILPFSNTYTKYEIRKGFDSNIKFYVNQDWYDEKGHLIEQSNLNFSYFCDFVHFLKGDLTDADLIDCEGLENIKGMPNLKLNGIQAKSDVLEKLGVTTHSLKELKDVPSFSYPLALEKKSEEFFLKKRLISSEYDISFGYISDIHLLHRAKANDCRTFDDIVFLIREEAKNIYKDLDEISKFKTDIFSPTPILIAGDVSSDFECYKVFFSQFSNKTYIKPGITFYEDVFVALGNHELWPFVGRSLKEIEDIYSSFLKPLGIHLLQNSLLFYDEHSYQEISADDLRKMDLETLRERCRSASFIVFGGIGFAGKNEIFNADSGIYRDVINREEEVRQSKICYELYSKVKSALYDKNVVVMTHMPLSDWAGKDEKPVDGFVYVSGHNHHNYYFDDGKTRIYSDNQIGYFGKRIGLKRLSLNWNYDWFSDYKDGIYEITKDDYLSFYKGIHLPSITFDRAYEKLFMLKKNGAYMFLLLNKGKFNILEGGRIRTTSNHSIEYFYKELDEYSKAIKNYLLEYERFQKEVSDEVKMLGGDGTIHGAIVDIDFSNHLYLNPLDGKITPYNATDIIEKEIYRNLPSLLKYQRPELYQNYLKMIDVKSERKTNLPKIVSDDTKISKQTIPYYKTDIYKASRILKGLQYISQYNVVRSWNDNVLKERDGRKLLENLLQIGTTKR